MTKPDDCFPFPGARWWKFDLHTHTPASVDYGKGPDQAALRRITPRDWLLGYMRAGIDCVAVTDHNSGAWIDRLQEALAAFEAEDHQDYRPLTLFPGVEITANGGVHVLAVLEVGCDSGDVRALLAKVGYEGQLGASESAAKCSPIEVVEAICEAGGVPVLAHVDGPAGAWKLSGNSLAPLLETDGLFALEVVDPTHERPQLYKDRKLRWAEVVGSDSHHPNGADGSHLPGSRFTWIKMAAPSLEGLRLALLDGGDFSLRRSDDDEPFDPFGTPKHLIEAIEVKDARYMGRGAVAKVQFSPWLNALVGGRGTGKSTVLHALRLAARRQHELGDERSGPRFTFREFDRLPRDRQDRGGLTATTAVRCTVKRDEVSHRVHWRQDAQGVVVEDRDENGWKESPSQSVTPQWFPLRLFSQGQIAELARGNQALLRVVDDAARVAEQRRTLDEARAAFGSSRAHIREIDQRLRREESLLVDMRDVERKLARFEDAGHQAVLTEYRQRERQRRVAEHQLRTAQAAADRVDAAAEDLELDDLPDGVFASSAEDREAVAALTRLGRAVATTAEHLREGAARLAEAPDDDQGEETERGIVAELLADLPDESGPRSEELERRIEELKQRIEQACAGEGDFRGHFNNYFQREFNRQPELLDKMLTWFPEDDLMVEHSPHGDSTGFRPIGQASAGERSAAMLAFLLAHGDEPLVLDQPEDDLDNHLIYDLVVRQIRENKLRRQIIVVTHNPNIVVNGDAEMVHVLRFANGQCVVGQSGSLQDADIREEVCEIMEGGREAFARRYRRLGRRPANV